MVELEFERVAPSHQQAALLIGELDRELGERYPREAIHGLHPGEAESFQGVFLVARLAGEPVACGAVRRLEPERGELKRMFVRPTARRRGVARRLLEELERTAKEIGLRSLRLETGERQPESIALYEAAGYRPIDAYGEYMGNRYSRCFEKELSP